MIEHNDSPVPESQIQQEALFHRVTRINLNFMEKTGLWIIEKYTGNKTEPKPSKFNIQKK